MARIESKVTAKNITALSISAAFNDAAYKDAPIPDAKFLAHKISKKFIKNINKAKISAAEKKELTEAKQEFLDIIHGELPNGFEIVPVLCHPRSDGYYKSRDEYEHGVQTAFIKFLGHTHEKELLSRGISKHVTELMKQGMLLGTTISCDVDHEAERNMCGTLTEEKSIDPLNKLADGETYNINHFNNLILLPRKVHKFKNRLRDLQLMVAPINEPTFLLTLAPTDPSFIALKQSNKKKFGMDIKDNYQIAQELISHLAPKPTKQTLNKKKRVTALKCITEELNRANRNVKSKKGNKANIKKLSKFFANKELHGLHNKVKTIDLKEVKELSKAIKEARDLLRANGVEATIPKYRPAQEISRKQHYSVSNNSGKNKASKNNGKNRKKNRKNSSRKKGYHP